MGEIKQCKDGGLKKLTESYLRRRLGEVESQLSLTRTWRWSLFEQAQETSSESLRHGGSLHTIEGIG
jgi:hypothetical protein